MRKITVVLEIQDQKESDALWNAHRDMKQILGCLITSISEGDLPQQLENLIEMDANKDNSEDF